MREPKLDLQPYGFRIWFLDERQFPLGRLVTEFFTCAILCKYPGLQLCFAAEGGVEGRVGNNGYKHRGYLVELRHSFDEFHLWISEDYCFNRGSTWVLRFWAKLWAALLTQELSLLRQRIPAGVILKLSPEQKDQALALIFLALRHVGGGRFAQTVMNRWAEERGKPIPRPYLAGLTDEDINRFFVPRPIA